MEKEIAGTNFSQVNVGVKKQTGREQGERKPKGI